MVKRTLLACVAGLIAVVAMTASPAGAVATTGQSSSLGIQCTNAVDIGLTVWNPPSDLNVRGSGSWTRCDSTFTRIRITLYKQVIGDFYKSASILNFDPADFGSHAASVWKRCDGSRHWYTYIEAFNSAGDLIMDKQSNTILVNC